MRRDARQEVVMLRTTGLYLEARQIDDCNLRVDPTSEKSDSRNAQNRLTPQLRIPSRPCAPCTVYDIPRDVKGGWYISNNGTLSPTVTSMAILRSSIRPSQLSLSTNQSPPSHFSCGGSTEETARPE